MTARSTLCTLLLVAATASGCVELDDSEVGSSQQAIIGGTINRDDPAVAALVFTYPGGQQSLCSGTLISPTVVLTAAHCLDGADAVDRVAYFGSELDGSDPDEIATIDIVDYTYDIGFDVDNLEAGRDIGMVRLAQAPSGVDPIPLNTTPTSSMIGTSMRLVGWGRTEPVPTDGADNGGGAGIKRETSTVIRSFQEAFQTQISPADLVAYGSASANTCQGDSGGPNFVTVDGVEYVAGITSFGTRDCSVAAGTRVDRYTSYISSYVGGGEAACIDDGICEAACATPDPDCAGGSQCGADSVCVAACGTSDPDCGGSSALTGGCSAAAGERGGSAPMWLLAFVALLAIRRRR
jgi:MYXO-CTERM domain-containing protein